jgi:hypothetical protein
MKPLFTTLFLLLLCSFSAFSQNFIWANGIGNGSADIGNDIVTDSSGNTILVGSFSGSITIDTITLSTSTTSASSSFVAKFNQAGDVVWAVAYAESSTSFSQVGGTGVTVDKTTGDIYVVGVYESSFTIVNTTLPYVSFGTDVYLIKFNSQGIAQWAKGFSGSNSDIATDVVFDPLSSSVYVAGISVDSITIDTAVLVATGTGFLPSFQYLTKFSSSGQFEWVKAFQTTSGGFFFFIENAGGIDVLSNGDVILAGYFSSSITFGTQTLNSTGSFDSEGYLCRFDSLGNLVWAQEIGGAGQDYVRDVAVDLNDNIWITGNVDGTATLDTFTFSGSNSGVFAARLDSAGNANFAYANGISGSNTGNGVAVDALGNAYFAGRYFNSITFGSFTLTGLTTFTTKLYISKYNIATSTWEWAIGPNYAVGSSSTEEARAIAVDEEDGVIVTGSYFGAMSLGANTIISSAGSQDIFLTKVGDCSGLSASFSATGPTTFCTGQSVTFQADTGNLYEYQWLFNGSALPGQINTDYTAIQSGSYTLIVDSLGCLDTATAVSVSLNASPNVTISAFGTFCENASPFVLTGGLPLGGTYSGPGVSSGVFNPSAAGPGTHPITYTYTSSNGCQDSEFSFVTVTASPFVFMLSQPSVCLSTAPFALTSGIPAGGTYSGTGVSGGVIFSPAVAGIGTHTIYYTRTTGLCSTTDSVNITVNGVPNVNLNPLPNICISTVLTPLLGGTPSGGVYSGTGVSNPFFFPSAVGVGQHDVIYTVTQNGCSSSDTATITVDPVPNPIMAQLPVLCENDTDLDLSLYAFPTGGVFSGPSVVGSTFSPAIFGIGSDSIVYTITNACGSDTAFRQITVQASPTVSLAAISDLCINVGVQSLSGGTPIGGIFSGTGVNGGTFDPTVAGVGSHLIKYSFTNTNGCTDSASTTITINPLPIVSLSAFSDICIDAGTQTLSGGSPSGGTYFGTGVSLAVFDPAVSGAGTFQIGYAYADANNCADTAYEDITVIPLPNVSLSAFADVCVDAGLQTLTGGLPIGGTYFGTGVTAGSFDPTLAGIGTTQIGYISAGTVGCTDTAFQTITVNPLPTVILSALSAVCIDAGTQTLSGGLPTGGTYFGTAVSAGVFDPAVSGSGTFQIGYAFSDSNSCADTAFQNMVVNPLPVVTLSAFADVCIDGGIQTSSGGLPVGGTYFGTGITVGVFDPITTGVGTFQIGYTFTDGNSCADTAFANITVNPLPTVTLSAFANVCIDAGSQALSGGLPIGGTYFGAGVSAGNFDPSTAGVGTHSIGYAFADANSCSDTAFQTIIVNPLPTVTLSAFSAVCIDAGTQTLSGGLPTGGTYFGTGVTAGVFDPAVSGAGTFQIGYVFSDSNSCADTAFQNMVVNPLPIVTLSTFSDVCIDAGTQTLSGGLPIGGIYFGTAVLAGTFDPITSGVGTFQIGYVFTDGNSCADTAFANITVNPLPTVTLSAFADVCVDAGSQALSGGLPIGGTYFGAGVSAGNFDPSIAGVGTHSIGYAFADANSCSDTAFQTIIVNPLPTVTLSALSAVCIDAGTQTLSGGLPTSGTYFGTGVTAGVFDPAVSGAGTFQIGYAFSDSNSCADTAFQNMVVNPLPVVTLSAFSDVCIDAGTQTLSGGFPVGGIYFGTAVLAGTFDPITSGVGTFQIGYTFTDGNSCADTAFANITVNPLPMATLSAFSAVCVDAGSQALSGGFPIGGTYFGTGVSSGNFDPSIAGVGIHSIGYAFADANSCSDTAFQTIIVNPLPTVTLTAFSAVCIDAGTQALSGGLPIGGTYFGTGVTAGVFDPAVSGAGTFQIGYTFVDGNNCTDTAFQNMLVNPLPTVSVSILDTICFNGANITLTSGMPTGGTYAGTGVSGNLFSSSIAGAGSHVISYSFSDVNGCSAQAEDSIFVRPETTVSLPSISDVCEDLNIFQLPTASPIGGLFTSTGSLIGSDTFDVANSGAGTFNVSYTITDVNGCVTIETQSFTVNTLPTVSFDLPTDSICENTPVELIGQSPLGGIFSGPNVSNDTIFTSDLEFSQSILYTYTDANGCVNSASDQLWVYPDPGIQFSEEPLQLCAGEVVSLDFADPIGGIFISEFVSNGLLTAPDTAFNGLGGIYSFGNVCGFDQDTFFLSVTLNPEIDLGKDTLICEGNTLVLDAKAHESYTWSDFSKDSTFTVNGGEFVAVGNQTISVVVSDSLGCSASDAITVTVAEQPAFYLGDNIYACLDSTIELSVDNVYDSYVWSTADTGLATIAHDGSIIMPGIYTFWATGFNATGCSYTDSISLRLADCDNEFVGIEEASNALNELVVYPNPTRANFYVRWNQFSTDPIMAMTMYDMFGSVVRNMSNESPDSELMEISTIGLADGVYLLTVNTAEASRTLRVLIQK